MFCDIPSTGILVVFHFSNFRSIVLQKMGMPEVPVRNKMKLDGIDSKVIATYFGEKLPDSNGNSAGGAEGKPMEPPCPKPDMMKYEKMKV